MNITVLTEEYPSSQRRYANAYVHTRSLWYAKVGHYVNVISFRASRSYVVDAIPVSTPDACDLDKSDVLVAHAPNVRNQLRFLKHRAARSIPLVLFFHGHEVLTAKDHYPAPYRFDRWGRTKRAAARLYDPLKLIALRSFLLGRSRHENLHLVFVSEWMMREAFRSLDLAASDEAALRSCSHIINNSAHPAFLENEYHPRASLDADCVTIRPLDQPKYAVDRVFALARNNPELTFHVYGKGRLTSHVEVPKNVTVIEQYFAQEQIPSLLDHYRAALMPTRLDAQGVMACEMATYGIPLVTSDIPVCREMLSMFPRVGFWDHSDARFDLSAEISRLSSELLPEQTRSRYAFDTTVAHELSLIESLGEKEPSA